MLISVINKLLLIILTMSILNIIRHGYYFIQAWLTSYTEEPRTYIISSNSRWFLSISIGIVVTSIIMGLKIG
jgi:hypothetical protein